MTNSTLPEGIRMIEDPAAPAIEVSVPASRAVIRLDGAQVTSWVPRSGSDVLWMSPLALEGEGAAIRGGVPLIGPWFGAGRDGRTSPKHGWLRTARWELDSCAVEGERAIVTLRLDGADPSGEGDRARLVVTVDERLRLDLTVTAGSAPLELEAALHTYLAVSDVRAAELEGFDGARYLDGLDGFAPRIQDGPLSLTAATDRVYEVPDPVAVLDPGAGRRIRETPTGSTRTVVWNPWGEGAASIADVPDDAWTGFVCVETAACKDGAVQLEPGAEHTLGVELTVEPA